MRIKRAVCIKLFETCALLIAMLLTQVTRNVAIATVTYRTVALTGQQAPGTPEGVAFGVHSLATHDLSMFPPGINQEGKVVFTAYLNGPNVVYKSEPHVFADNIGIWSDRYGPLEKIVRQTDPVANLSGYDFTLLAADDLPLIDDTGGIFSWAVVTSGGGEYCLWLNEAGENNVIAGQGIPVPDLPSTSRYISSFYFGDRYTGIRPVLSSNGYLAFAAEAKLSSYSGSETMKGIWANTTGSLNLALRSGDAAPGTYDNIVFTGFDTPALNSAGQIAFRGHLGSKSSSYFHGTGIWLWEAGNTELIVRHGDLAIDAGPETKFGFNSIDGLFTNPSINSKGQVAFGGAVYGPNVDQTNNYGIWSQAGGNLHMVARRGNPAPDTEPGTIFDSFGAFTLISGNSVTAFTANLTGPDINSGNDLGLWLESKGVSKLILREGNTLPGLPGDKTIWSFSSGLEFVMNDYGQIAAIVRYQDGMGIWATDRQGGLLPVLKTGDQIDVNDDPWAIDMRTVTSMRILTGSGGHDGRATSFNDNGEIATHVFFSDGSQGIFVATIPEPGSVAMLMASSGLMLRRRSG